MKAIQTVLLLAAAAAAANAYDGYYDRNSLLKDLIANIQGINQESEVDVMDEFDEADAQYEYYGSEMDINAEVQQNALQVREGVAQAMCQSRFNIPGRDMVLAVPRVCSNNQQTCNDICKRWRHPTRGSLTCGAGYFFFHQTKAPRVRSIRAKCDRKGCGPNICCCVDRRF